MSPSILRLRVHSLHCGVTETESLHARLYGHVYSTANGRQGPRRARGGR